MTPPSPPDVVATTTEPCLVAGWRRASLLSGDGEVLDLAAGAVEAALAGEKPPLLVHGPASWRRLGLPPRPAYDLLELFAFACPAVAAAPTPRGLALALDLAPPRDRESAAMMLHDIAARLLDRVRDLAATPNAPEITAIAQRMAQAGWGWGAAVLAALREGGAAIPGRMDPADALRIWRRLPKWEETAPRSPPATHPVGPAEARTRLAGLLGAAAESRAGQSDYAHAAAAAFAPRAVRGDPVVLLAEAGTGTGKTLGYLAPASLWAERNQGTVWISTYTRHLQRQIEAESRRVYADHARAARARVVLRKGRENYLCLLNMEDAVNAAANAPASTAAIGLGLIARWARASADGDILGGDLPGWFVELFGRGYTAGLADRRGECIHGACPHYQTCFVEHSIRRARHADLVVANHALVMVQAAMHGRFGTAGDEDALPTRYVFDEGHHLFDAADSAFAVTFSGAEAAELRRWLLGAEGARSRARGLRRRLDELVAGHEGLEGPLDAALQAARALPAPGWALRLSPARATVDGDEDAPADEPVLDNPSEALLHRLRVQVLARIRGAGASSREPGRQAECDIHPVPDEVAAMAARLERALDRIATPLNTLAERLLARLEDEGEDLDTPTRLRIEAAARTLLRRAIGPLEAWSGMLRDLGDPPPEPGMMPVHVLFLRLEAREGQTLETGEVGLHRHWLDPTVPFAATLAAPAHGLLVTSATLRDETGPAEDVTRADAPRLDAAEEGWRAAEAHVGANHLPSPALRASVASPFDYARQTRTFVVTDVAHGETGALAGAFRTLFTASGGGGLGLFTAISRLRAVHARLAPALEAEGIGLYAQHVDAMDNATLVDIFRTETDSCLLGTDAMRDGVDVPGRALRLVVFERVPWPRPDILHRERRTHLAGEGAAYDDRIARLRLRQAFGRLIRSAGDRGVFVLLDRRMPSRLLGAFPRGVAVERVGLAQAAAAIRDFLPPA